MYKIYSKVGCTYCDKAVALLKQKGLPFQKLMLDQGQVKVDEVEYYTLEQLKALVPGVKTVPQIFEDDKLLGGFDALKLKLA